MIAIIGSVDETRKLDPPLRNPAQACAAAEALGRALAEKGDRILVYTAEAAYLETFVVKGYVASGKATPKSIVARFPISDESEFAEYAAHRELFDPQRDPSGWETSFYRSLRDVDG